MKIKPPEYISNSQLTAFKKSPAHWLQYILEEKITTPAMLLGKVAHCLALQPEKFKDQFVIYDEKKRPRPDMNFNGKENRKWRNDLIEQAKASKLILVDKETHDHATNMVHELKRDFEAKKWLDGEYEKDLRWKFLGFTFYGIRDITHNDYIVDLKFVQSADPFVFQRYLFREGVYRQGGMYLDGEMNGQFTGEPHKRVIFIAVESSPPYGVSVHELDYEVINAGVNEYRRLSEQLKECIDANFFPSYSFRSISGTFDVTLPNFLPTE